MRCTRKGTALENILQQLILHKTRAVDSRTIMYCRTVNDAKEIASKLQCNAYYADADVSRKKQILDDFLSVREAVIASTGILGLEIDVTDVHLVVHIGLPWSLLDFVQQSGQAG
jgi:superfamily II DNA helicase RecQ